MRRLGLLVVVGALALSGCGGAGNRSDDGSLVDDYCSYGAVSEAQLEGCIEHVSVEDIDELDTNAAEFARGELDDCRPDAGPFCEPRD